MTRWKDTGNMQGYKRKHEHTLQSGSEIQNSSDEPGYWDNSREMAAFEKKIILKIQDITG